MTYTVAHVIDSGGLYGAEKVVLALSAAVRRRGDSALIVPIESPCDEQHALGEAAEQAGLPVLRKTMHDGVKFAEMASLCAQLKKLGVSVVNTHGYRANILFSLLPRRRRLPLVATIHGWTSSSRLGRDRLIQEAECFCVRYADSVVAVSSPIAQALRRRHLSAGRLHLIPNGIELAESNGSAPPSGFPGSDVIGPRTVVIAGRLSAEKGVVDGVEAFGRAVQRVPDARLAIFGDGELRIEVEAAVARLPDATRVSMFGYVPDAGRCFGRAGLLLLPSLREGTPIVVLEALRAGLPIVAAAVGGVPDMLGGGRLGKLVEPRDIGAMADAIVETLSGSESAVLRAQAGRRHVAENLSIDAIASRYDVVYRACLGEAQ